ncbi:hypothetical protein D9758_004530 [Tetrapyrgos nigripes]|uniref:Uncharacterized protein n=1 Tax=Tetrapyrgos nigripes TaxID=182062 RepID=A0A8H5H070_9AGAR|nr:hypothetical protein D9758_004530 [Tetrapyrgos nigripes]
MWRFPTLTVSAMLLLILQSTVVVVNAAPAPAQAPEFAGELDTTAKR